TRKIDAGYRVVVLLRVLGEGLSDEDPGVVNQGVDAAEALEASGDDVLGDGEVSDVALDGDDVVVAGGGNAARVGDDCVAEFAVRTDEVGADALRRASDHGDLLAGCAHGEFLLGGSPVASRPVALE